MNKNMVETPNETPDNEDIEEYVTPSLSLSKDIKTKLDESGKKYPIWNPKKIGEIVGGIVENVEFLEHLNENNGGWLIRVVDDNKDKFVTFPNVVLTKKLLSLCPSGEMIELKGKYIFMQYDGEQQPKNPKLKPYKTYTVIEE
jgi:hypothetical protein